ncbi:HNH endonuclease [Pseudomonas sp. TH34]|uniref:HNH endonuclease signature motif containing protein n=1 Tax=Pseudomonas sp. TH34 TaxID=2796399 RepID=UPI001913926D|nr:HNH endonuclease [Pseudomonas sp. TH34]MBK5407362.1 HNH endonuclease [Pseudomonas sp. TH34]
MKLCAICGIRPGKTSDHIPPKGLYTKPYPKNMHTVPACAKCNQGGSTADEIVKIMIGLSTGEARKDAPLVIESMRRTLGGNKKLFRKVLKSAQHTFHPMDGSVLRPAIAVRFDGRPYREVVTRIVRALYWVEKGSALGLDANVTVEAFDQIKDPGRIALIQTLMDSLEPRHLNESTFIYKVAFDKSGSSVWGLMFFGAHLAIAMAEAPADSVVP